MIVREGRNHPTQHNQRNVVAAKSDQHRETQSAGWIPGANPGPHLKKNSRATQQYIQSDEHDRNAPAPGTRGVLEQEYLARNAGATAPGGIRFYCGFHCRCRLVKQWVIELCQIGMVSA